MLIFIFKLCNTIPLFYKFLSKYYNICTLEYLQLQQFMFYYYGSMP